MTHAIRILNLLLLTAALTISMVISGCGDDQQTSSSETVEPAENDTTSEQSANQNRAAQNSRPRNNKQQDHTTSPFTISPLQADFGTVEPHSLQEQNFDITNTGNQPITVLDAIPTCKCTTLIDMAGKTIAPGETLTMPASLQLTARPGKKSSSIRLLFDINGQRRSAKVELLAEVQMAVRTIPPYVDALKGKNTGRIRVESVNGEPFRILSSNGEPPSYANYNPETDDPQSEYLVNWSVEGWPCEGIRLWWIIETDHPEAPIVPARVRHRCSGGRADMGRFQRGWHFYELIINAEQITAGEPKTIEIEVLVTEGSPTVTGVESLNPNATARLLGTSPGGEDVITCEVEFTPAEEYEGMLYARVNVISSTGEHPVAVVGKVVPPGE